MGTLGQDHQRRFPASAGPVITSCPDAVTLSPEEVARALARHGIVSDS